MQTQCLTNTKKTSNCDGPKQGSYRDGSKDGGKKCFANKTYVRLLGHKKKISEHVLTLVYESNHKCFG